MPTTLGECDACTLRTLFERGDASPVEAAEAALERIERFNGSVNAYCYVDHEDALRAARESETRWQRGAPVSPLDGVPASMKDLSEVAGMPVRDGSLTTSDALCERDGPPAQFLREAGSVLLGKTCTPEFGWKATTDSRVTGITRNPWNTDLTPGGSSGGAAVAAALNMGVLHQGGDSGGSIRIPAAFTGVFGFKSTYGWVPQWPPSTMASLSHIGPLTRTVDDAIAMLNVIGRFQGHDYFSVPGQPEDWGEKCDGEADLKGLKIAFCPALGTAARDDEVSHCVGHAAQRLEELGARVDRIEPEVESSLESYRILWSAASATQVADMMPQQKALLDPGLLEIAEWGRAFSAVDLLRAQSARIRINRHLDHFFDSYDLILTPTVPITAFEVGHEVPPGSGMRDWMEWTPFTYPFNLTQQPAASVPCGFTQAGLPIGLQIVGARFEDTRVLRVCRAYMEACPARFPERLNESRPEVSAGE